jgi:hypothetical protein
MYSFESFDMESMLTFEVYVPISVANVSAS